ncbi:MAG: hypothetical protein CUN49_05340 [Candidatus Thermofonsia Clade 1 bacterium]|jgi:ubiquinone/menaquinone biosynthesis C-methylase UbiE|uniref:Methyltransferase type 11 domain-containing protein n=1 Tax=Candidatus Thermofonsia Clade 1 bacterium TaxID=2364210 RepID=A0A2M8PFY3_9CHLR|nr:MAG: hypothetical protein CUN49_05340 [Candidatus Thermofonsia Clade 1 bacterium]RMF50130.1 MAG: methyltransferase domain-containing protein [Chloroflexota bacterium]
MPIPELDSLRALYAQTAPHYHPDIASVMDIFARSLAAWMARCVREQAQGSLHDPFDLPQRGACPSARLGLDIGTGTGLLARHLAGFTQRVIGVDISAAMLAVGQRQRHRNVAFWQADLHRLPLARASVDLIGASFGLNHSLPRRALRELIRVLRPNGLLLCQEWSVLDTASQTFESVFEAALGDQSAPAFDLPEPWQAHLQDVEDYYALFKAAGFSLVWAREAAFVRVRFPSAQAFSAYKLAWAPRRLAFEALSEAEQRACLEALQTALAPYCAADGSLLWQPRLMRVCAIR